MNLVVPWPHIKRIVCNKQNIVIICFAKRTAPHVLEFGNLLISTWYKCGLNKITITNANNLHNVIIKYLHAFTVF